VLTALSPLIFTEVFADSFIVDFNQQQYSRSDSLTISGEILDFGMPVIALSIYDPNGKILSANNLEISSQNTFSKTISLDSPFYEKIGEYMVKLDYGQISENHYFVIKNEYSEPEILVEDFEKPEMVRESLLLYCCWLKSTINESAKTSVKIKGDNAVNTIVIPSKYPNTRVKT